MLVLSRREKQKIKVGDSIIITIVRVSGDKVRVGIEAPSNVLVLRDELEAFPTGTDRTGNSQAIEQSSPSAITAEAVKSV